MKNRAMSELKNLVAEQTQGLKQKQILSLNFFPGWGLVAGVDTYEHYLNDFP